MRVLSVPRPARQDSPRKCSRQIPRKTPRPGELQESRPYIPLRRCFISQFPLRTSFAMGSAGYQGDEQPIQKVEPKPIISGVTKCAKKKEPSEKWSRESKENFSHEWLLSLKGHSAAILDMDFSSNSKFLATCADGRLRKGMWMG